MVYGSGVGLGNCVGPDPGGRCSTHHRSARPCSLRPSTGPESYNQRRPLCSAAALTSLFTLGRKLVVCIQKVLYTLRFRQALMRQFILLYNDEVR